MKPYSFMLFVLAAVLAGVLGTGTAHAQVSPGMSGTMVPAPAPALTHSSTRHVAASRLSRSLEFSNLAAAAAHCPNDVVVWTTLSRSHSFHLSGSRYYGRTRHGAYVCKGDALAAGFHQAKS